MPFPLSRNNRIVKSKRTQSSHNLYQQQKISQTQQTQKVNDQYFFNHKSGNNNIHSDSINIKNINTLKSQQIENLKNQIKLKDRAIIQYRQKLIQVKSLQSQLVETYRVIHFYEGKIGELEKIIKSYEQTLNKQNLNSEINKLLVTYQNNNIQMSAKLQQLIFDKEYFLKRSYKYQKKYQNLKKRIAISQRKQTDIQKYSNRQSQSSLRTSKQLKSTLKFNKTIYQRIKKIQQDLEMIKSQNENLLSQLSKKTQQNKQLQKKYKKLEQKNSNPSKYMSSYKITPNPKTTVVSFPKSILSQIKKPIKQQLQKDSSTSTSRQIRKNNEKQQFSFKIQNVLRKLKYHLMRSNYNHSILNQIFIQHPERMSQLIDTPYKLSVFQVDFLEKQIQKQKHSIIKILPKYSNLTFALQKLLNTQVSNVNTLQQQAFRNRYDQTQRIIKRHGNKISHSIVNNYLINWGLSLEQIEFIGLKSFQQTGQLQDIDFTTISSYFLNN